MLASVQGEIAETPGTENAGVIGSRRLALALTSLTMARRAPACMAQRQRDNLHARRSAFNRLDDAALADRPVALTDARGDVSFGTLSGIGDLWMAIAARLTRRWMPEQATKRPVASLMAGIDGAHSAAHAYALRALAEQRKQGNPDYSRAFAAYLRPLGVRRYIAIHSQPDLHLILAVTPYSP